MRRMACRAGIAHSVWAECGQVGLLAHRPKMDDSMREGGGWVDVVDGLVSTARKSFGGKRQRVRKRLRAECASESSRCGPKIACSRPSHSPLRTNWSGNGPQPGLTSTRELAGKDVGCGRDQPPILELIPSSLPARAAAGTVRLRALKPCPSAQASMSDRKLLS